MFRNASLPLHNKAKLGGQPFAALNPFPNGRLRDTADAGQSGL